MGRRLARGRRSAGALGKARAGSSAQAGRRSAGALDKQGGLPAQDEKNVRKAPPRSPAPPAPLRKMSKMRRGRTVARFSRQAHDDRSVFPGTRQPPVRSSRLAQNCSAVGRRNPPPNHAQGEKNLQAALRCHVAMRTRWERGATRAGQTTPTSAQGEKNTRKRPFRKPRIPYFAAQGEKNAPGPSEEKP